MGSCRKNLWPDSDRGKNDPVQVGSIRVVSRGTGIVADARFAHVEQ